MKKKVGIILGLIVIMGALICGYFFFFNNHLFVTKSQLINFKAKNETVKEDWEKPFKEVFNEFKLGDLPDNVSSKEQVKSFYGEPEQIIPYAGTEQEEWIYKDMKFYFNGDFITKYTVTSPKYPTSKGLKVGDQIEEVKKLYPDAHDWKERSEYYYERWAEAEDSKGKFAVIFHMGFKYNENNEVTEIWRSSEVD